VEDGVGGARSDLSPAPSVDIANNAPDGTGATNRIVISWDATVATVSTAST
jgi:hypothetical protein